MIRASLLMIRHPSLPQWQWLAMPALLIMAIACLSVDVSAAAPADMQWLSNATGIANATAMQEQGVPLDTDIETPERRPGINFLTLLTRGGWFMLPLLVLSILVVTIGVERFLALPILLLRLMFFEPC